MKKIQNIKQKVVEENPVGHSFEALAAIKESTGIKDTVLPINNLTKTASKTRAFCVRCAGAGACGCVRAASAARLPCVHSASAGARNCVHFASAGDRTQRNFYV